MPRPALVLRLALLTGLAACFAALALMPERALLIGLTLALLLAGCLWAWPEWWIPLTAVGLIGVAGALAMVWSQRRAPPATGMSPLGAGGGRAIFYGKGYCSSCHTLADHAGGLRGPPLGATQQQPPIGRRAVARAEQLSRARGRPLSPADYLVESLLEPGAFVVDGYRDEMPPAHLPPVRLQPDEIRALVAFLLEQGGDADPAAIELPAAAWPDAALAVDTPAGDLERGKRLYFDLAGPAACAACHPLPAPGRAPQSRALGPDLSRIGGVRGADFLRRSILEPSAQIAGGFDTVQLELLDGTVVVGLNRGGDPSEVRLVRHQDLAAAATGAAAPITGIPRSQIRSRSLQPLSAMPGNYAEILTEEEVRDLVAYLSSLK